MSEPFLIVNDILAPEADFDGYRAWEDTLREQIPMISGRMVEEVRGKVWRIDYASGQMRDTTVKQLLAALRALPEGTRAVVVLKYFEDRSVEEIAAQLAVPVGTVKSRLFNARRMLCELLEKGVET